MKIILVIPDGLSQKNLDFKISKTYQSALDLSIKESKLTSAIICLLPGNKFGSSNFEQFWAFNYLINKNIRVMTRITKEEVTKVAHLARLELNEDAISNHAEQLE